jgi:predicted anti-sigma-YlaC factor YlaD
MILHPHKTMSKIKRMNKLKMKLMIKMKALIKGEMRMMGTMKDRGQGCHIQESTKPYKEITPWTIFLMILKRG